MENQQFYDRLDNIEGEVVRLRLLLASSMQKRHKKIVSLKGIAAGIKVEEEDFEKKDK